MKKLFGALLCSSLFFSYCIRESNTFEIDPMLPSIGLINWTGHWDAICSPGQTLIFSITHELETETFEINADSGAGFRKAMEEGDMLRIVIMDLNRNIILSRSKEYWPEDPVINEFGLVDNQPTITVCQIDRLDISGF